MFSFLWIHLFFIVSCNAAFFLLFSCSICFCFSCIFSQADSSMACILKTTTNIKALKNEKILDRAENEMDTFVGHKSYSCRLWHSLQSRRILERDPWIVFRNDVVPPSWMLILPESWDESKSDFKGEVQCNVDLREVLWTAVLVKTRVCGGCVVWQAHKTSFRLILFCICLRANAETASFLLGVEDSHPPSNNVLLNQWDQSIVQ